MEILVTAKWHKIKSRVDWVGEQSEQGAGPADTKPTLCCRAPARGYASTFFIRQSPWEVEWMMQRAENSAWAAHGTVKCSISFHNYCYLGTKWLLKKAEDLAKNNYTIAV